MLSLTAWSKTAGVILIAITLASCFHTLNTPESERVVVVYTSVDQVFSEPLLKRFEGSTGIRVLVVYDVEATKTTGLVNRIISEKRKPLCDVWWSGEFVQTILLEKEGTLTPYQSASAEGIPSRYIGANWNWVGFGGRARVLLVNTNLVSPSQIPRSLLDLTKTDVPANKIGIAYPMFGTAATHAATLYAQLGPEKTKAFFTELRDSGITVVDGNSVVRDLVANGQLAMGLTDTDDAIGAISDGAPVKMVFLDQGEGEMGTLITPNTVALIRGAPHPTEAKILIDYLLSSQVESELVESGWLQISLRPVAAKQSYFDASSVRGINVDYEKVYGYLEQVKKDLAEIFIR
ncbi:MAG: extracellular solute-binding protein [Candidatus Bathyarchaeota archaeon]|nr:extracellular solute-binding protein [Candidatus Bathyarchaeota archaeon]